MDGYIYILCIKAFLQKRHNIYKIGRTHDIFDRINGYPAGSKLFFTIFTTNVMFHERYIISKFSEIFIQRKDIGTEYFEGNVVTMIEKISNYITCNYEQAVFKSDYDVVKEFIEQEGVDINMKTKQIRELYKKSFLKWAETKAYTNFITCKAFVELLETYKSPHSEKTKNTTSPITNVHIGGDIQSMRPREGIVPTHEHDKERTDQDTKGLQQFEETNYMIDDIFCQFIKGITNFENDEYNSRNKKLIIKQIETRFIEHMIYNQLYKQLYQQHPFLFPKYIRTCHLDDQPLKKDFANFQIHYPATTILVEFNSFQEFWPTCVTITRIKNGIQTIEEYQKDIITYPSGIKEYDRLVRCKLTDANGSKKVKVQDFHNMRKWMRNILFVD